MRDLKSNNFSVNQYLFDKSNIYKIEADTFTNNYPVVYILYDLISKQAYIGESTNAMGRMGNHLSNSKKNHLKYVYIISSPLFNKSSALDIESNLIKYMSADNKFTLLNGNAGIAEHNYYQKNLYFDVFEQVWDNLKLKKVVSKDILDLDNSDLFKYSPYKSLSTDQENSIQEYLNIISKKDKGAVFIEGSAGTGKTILAVYLIKLLMTDFDIDDYSDKDSDIAIKLEQIKEIKDSLNGMSIALVIPMVSLRKTLKKVFRSIRGLSAKMVIGPSEVVKQDYDILVVDEAHRLRRRRGITNYKSFDDNNRLFGLDNSGTELDWIQRQSKHQIFFYDEAQSVRPSDIPKERFIQLKSVSDTLKLTSQMRVNAGDDYVKFVHHLLNPENKSEISKFSSENYDLKLFDSLPEMISILEDKEKEHGLCRMMSGYSWKWVSKNSTNPDTIIDGVELFWNRVPHNWINSTTSLNEMGCIHTTQGYDLNYAGVIFGKEIVYNKEKNCIDIIRDNYFDANGKAGVTDIKVLKEYIINIYKTLMFRGIKGVYVYCCDEGLRQYFRKHIEMFQ